MPFIASNDPDRQEIWSWVGPLTNTINKQRVRWFHHKSKTGAFCTLASNHSLSSGEKTGNAPALFSLGEISQQTVLTAMKASLTHYSNYNVYFLESLQQIEPHRPWGKIYLSSGGRGGEQHSGLLNTSQLTSQTRDRVVSGQLSTLTASPRRNMGISAHPNTSLNSGF